MLTKNLQITYSMVWSVALANVLGAGLCYLFSGQFARLATLRYTLILPAIMAIMYVGAFQASRNWGDLWTLLIFGVLGWTMKRLQWPRPPLILGFVLGSILERYLFISIQRFGFEWILRPIVLAIFAVALLGLMRPLIQDVRAYGGLRAMLTRGYSKPVFTLRDIFPVALVGLTAYMLWDAWQWNFSAKIVPMIVGGMVIAFATISLVNTVFRRASPPPSPSETGRTATPQEKLHMDLQTDMSELSTREVLWRAGMFVGWLLLFMGSMATIGLLPTVPLFVCAFMRLEGRENWFVVTAQALGITLFVYIVFDQLLTIPWPPTLLGAWFPAMKFLPSV